MAGASSGYSPDSMEPGGTSQGPAPSANPGPGVCVWLCRQPAGTGDPNPPTWLTDTEQQRFGTLAAPRAREFLASRWLIRQALSAVCTGQYPPEQCRPVPGRPVASQLPAGWRLSISHSQGLAACALSRQPLGVDLEPLQRRPGWQKVTRRWFSETEQAWLLERDDPQAFLQAWTFKEAWLKATGRGIAGNLQTLEVGRGYELSGDHTGVDWQASSLAIDDFLVTVVYQTPEEAPQTKPAFRWLTPPPQDFTMSAADQQTIDASRALHRHIIPAIAPTTPTQDRRHHE